MTGNYGKALSLFNSGKYKLAEIAIARAIAAVPANQRTNYYYFWKYQSAFFGELKKYDAAIKAINIAIELEPTALLLHNEKARILSNSKKYLEAISIYTDLIQTKPEAFTYYSRGTAKFAIDKQGAIGDFDRAIAINPQFANAYVNRGNAKYAMGNNQGAIGDLSKAGELFRQQGQMDLYQQAMGLIAKLKGS